jgi:NADH-quinone oxidoreductase subunit N
VTTALSPLNAATLVPLLALVCTALGILVADLLRAPWRFAAWLSLAGMVVTLALTLIVVLSGQSSAVQGMLNVDGPAAQGTLFFCGAGAVTVLLELGSASHEAGARYALLAFAVSGAAIVAQSTHALAFTIGLAILYTGVISLLGTRERWRYYALHCAALASTVLGLALLYGVAGSLRTDTLIERLNQQAFADPQNTLSVLGLAVLIGGLGLPLGIVPFRMGFTRSSHDAHPPGMLFASLLMPGAAALTLARLTDLWPARARLVLVTLGALSVLYGYAQGLRSHYVQGVLSGVTIAQSGYLALGAALQARANWAPLFCVLTSQGLSLTCLWAVAIDVRRNDARPLTLDDLAGLGRHRPWLAAATTVCLLNLSGLFPLIGATGQMLTLQAAAAQGYALQAALAVAGILLAWLLAGRWIRTMWAGAPQERVWLPSSPEVIVGALATASSMLLIGLYAQGALDWFASLSIGPQP